MAKPTPEQMKYLEERFFDEERNTRVGFDRISDIYGVSGRDAIVEDISLRILGESNEGRAVYSDSYEKNFAFGNDYATAGNLHKEKGLPWYHFSDDDITRKLPGVESGFIDII
jgi:hypothetical protein